MNTVNNSIPVKPEWTMAIYDSIRILMKRGYIHSTNDIQFVRPSYDSVFPCAQGGEDGPLDLNQLRWAVEKGDFWFLWYKETFLKVNINKGKTTDKLKLDPTKENIWEFVCMIDGNYK